MALAGRKTLSFAHPVCSVFLCITLAWGGARLSCAQQVTAKEPPSSSSPTDGQIPDDPYLSHYPTAQLVAPASGEKLDVRYITSERKGDLVTLNGDVVIVYGDYVVHADKVIYNLNTWETEAEGHVKLTGRGATMEASHGQFNLRDGTGRFYDVKGSISLNNSKLEQKTYSNGNPFLFSGRMVTRSAVDRFDIYDGAVTSCQLPQPDWQLAAGHFHIHGTVATAKNSNFQLFGVPILYLPYVSHPVDGETRQSGFMIPSMDPSVSKKGFVVREEFYLALSRSQDLMVGLEYFSQRGFQQYATYRYRGRGTTFFTGRYSFLMDRGYRDQGNNLINQGGQDIVAQGRHEFNEHTRFVADAEYLSSYVYREAFSNSFNQAVTSDIVSHMFVADSRNGFVTGMDFERYQGLKRVATVNQTQQEVRIFHAPSFNFDVMERRIGKSPLIFGAENSVAVLKRAQQTFTSDISERVDIHPKLSVPFSVAGFKIRPGFGMRETFYTHSKAAAPLPGATAPKEVYSSINRAAVEANIEFRPPVLERVFDTGALSRWLGRSVKHTIEPYAYYRFRNGINNFDRILRFDTVDVASDTNEVEYGVTQRLFLRPTRMRPCKDDETPAEPGGLCGGRGESLLWRLSQKRYFDKTFGGALVDGRRNVLENTLDFSGVAFLTDQRDLSPIQSQMRLSATENLDIEWDMNYDTHAGKFTQSNVFVNFHVGDYFGGVSHARLNAPGRFQTSTSTPSSSATSDFSQLRLLLGYGSPTKRGFSAATNVGLDLNAAEVQFGSVQTGYNWNCCGINVEYRKYELGPVRNENVYRFNFTLANIGSAGNLRRSERLF